MSGFEGEAVLALAATDVDESMETVLGRFRAAATEIGAELPEPGASAAWAAHVADEMERQCRLVPPRSKRERFDDCLRVVIDNLVRLSSAFVAPEVSSLVQHLSRYLESTIDDYESWLDELGARRDALTVREGVALAVVDLLGRVVRVISALSYGAYEQEHVTEIRRCAVRSGQLLESHARGRVSVIVGSRSK